MSGIGGTQLNRLDGPPATFTKASSNGRDYNVTQGDLTKMKLRSAVLNEHVESSNKVQGMIGVNNIVGQFFRMSTDNINGIAATAESNQASVFDNFNSGTYINNAALQAVWVESGSGSRNTVKFQADNS